MVDGEDLHHAIDTALLGPETNDYGGAYLGVIVSSGQEPAVSLIFWGPSFVSLCWVLFGSVGRSVGRPVGCPIAAAAALLYA